MLQVRFNCEEVSWCWEVMVVRFTSRLLRLNCVGQYYTFSTGQVSFLVMMMLAHIVVILLRDNICGMRTLSYFSPTTWRYS